MEKATIHIMFASTWLGLAMGKVHLTWSVMSKNSWQKDVNLQILLEKGPKRDYLATDEQKMKRWANLCLLPG